MFPKCFYKNESLFPLTDVYIFLSNLPKVASTCYINSLIKPWFGIFMDRCCYFFIKTFDVWDDKLSCIYFNFEDLPTVITDGVFYPCVILAAA